MNNQNNQKRSSKLSATLLALTLTVTALWVSPVWAQEAPQYGGTHTTIMGWTIHSWSPYDVDTWSTSRFVYEDLGMVDWTARHEVDYTGGWVAREYQTGLLAESWEQPDAGTIIFHIREGVHWHNKPPANGRELTAHDVEWSWHRLTGLGSGFTKPLESRGQGDRSAITSVEASDQYTVVFKFEPQVTMLDLLLVDGHYDAIVNREAVEEWGDLDTWQHTLGTGPFMVEEAIEGTSYTWVKNPNYWGHDEDHPENQLPYLDRFWLLEITDFATQKTAFRTGKIDDLGGF